MEGLGFGEAWNRVRSCCEDVLQQASGVGTGGSRDKVSPPICRENSDLSKTSQRTHLNHPNHDPSAPSSIDPTSAINWVTACLRLNPTCPTLSRCCPERPALPSAPRSPRLGKLRNCLSQEIWGLQASSDELGQTEQRRMQLQSRVVRSSSSLRNPPTIYFL